MSGWAVPEGKEFLHGFADLAALQLLLQILQTFLQHGLVQSTERQSRTGRTLMKPFKFDFMLQISDIILVKHLLSHLLGSEWLAMML